MGDSDSSMDVRGPQGICEDSKEPRLDREVEDFGCTPVPEPVPPVTANVSRADDWNQTYDRYHKAYYLDDAASDAWLEQQTSEAAKAYRTLRLWNLNKKSRARVMGAELQREALPRWLHSSDVAEQMHAECILGYFYYYGLGCEKDNAQAATWYHRSADRGHAEAQNMLGFCNRCGHGVPQDLNQAASWYRKAADQGHAAAQCNLAACYLNGSGVTADHDQAIILYRKSAAQGYNWAISELSRMKVSIS